MENKYDFMPRESFGATQREPTDEKYASLKEVFEENGLEDKSLILENDLWFYDEMIKKDPNNFLHLIFTKGLNPETGKMSVKSYIADLVHTLNEIDTRLKKLKSMEEDLQNKGKSLQIVLDQVMELEEEYAIKGHKYSFTQNTVTISYASSERNSYNMLNNQSPISYQGGISLNDMKPIHEEKEHAVCILKVEPTTQFIYISILSQNNGGKQEEIAMKKLPIEEVYTAHHPKVFALKEIPRAYLIIPYHVITEKEVELKFELNLTYEIRSKILKQLIMMNENQRSKANKKFNDAFQHLNLMLKPFEKNLKYKLQQGFIISKRKNRACDNCTLF